MPAEFHSSHAWLSKPTLYPQRAKWLRRLDGIAQLLGVSCMVIGHGLRRTGISPWEFGLPVMLAMAVITIAIWKRFHWSLARLSFTKRHFPTVAAAMIWTGGIVLITIIGPVLPDTNGPLAGGPRFWWYVHLSELILFIYSGVGLVRGLRKLTAGGINPAFLLVSSFLALITVGTLTLMLPICRNVPPSEIATGAPFQTALFTATSASCVTGLVVVDTGTYWSAVGQTVILIMFQIGGLGIMTFGAFFAAIAGRNVRLTEFATLRELLSSDSMGDIRRLIFAILGFTFTCEVIGALLLMPLWDDLPLHEQIGMSLFHSVSAFCNAGFALTDDSFVGQAHHPSVWGGLSGLIIIGGFGFAAMYNLGQLTNCKVRNFLARDQFHLPRQRKRLNLTTRFALFSTIVLLISGTIGLFLLEKTGPANSASMTIQDAWFQSVTFRTAGFNTVDLGALQPASKVLAVLFMIIGASPGSTGGGVKTVVFAVAIFGLASVLRGRDRVEAGGRTIPATLVNRALAILFVSLLTIMVTTLLLVIFERRPDLFLDHLFEATSAVGTVGVSTTITDASGHAISTTQSLSSVSRNIIVLAMLLGRVGPLTLLLALTSERAAARYNYPEERVTLG